MVLLNHTQDLQMLEATRDLKRTLDILSGIRHLCEGYYILPS